MLKKYFNKFTPIILFIPFALFVSINNISKENDNNALTSFTNYFVKSKMDQMTLREKIAQMVISSTIPENYDINSSDFKRLKKLCCEIKVGGFIFFKGSAREYVSLSNQLQDFSETPLLISADFERGTGMRVSDGTLFPNNMAIGATNDPQLAYQMGLIIAAESRAMGICQDYAPVCDVNNNPDNPIINVRSFGENPTLVSLMSEAEIKGLQENKVIATAKHFPGHGDTEVDSHKDLPILNFSLDRLNKIELVPFKNAIAKNVMSVMIAHLSFPELEPDPTIPASLSNNIVQNLLIDKLGFTGLVVTDALNMKGITKNYNTDQVAIKCVEAGIDLILMPLNEEKTIIAIESAIKNGKISEDRINRSVEKILLAKQWLGLNDNKIVNENNLYTKINNNESNLLSQKIADASITLVKDDKNTVPIKMKNSRILALNISDGKDNINSDFFTNKVKDYYLNSDIYDINYDVVQDSIKNYINMATNYDAIILAVYAKIKYGTGRISLLQSHIDLLKSLTQTNSKTIVISFGNPYLLKDFPSVPCYICTYGDANVSIIAALKALSGEISFKGKLPVSINDEYIFGTGILK